MGFAEYASAFLPLPPRVTAIAAIVLLTAVNHFGVSQGVATQNALTVIKAAAIGALIVFGLSAAPRAVAAPAPAASVAGFGIAMIPALWTYDGWYGADLLRPGD